MAKLEVQIGADSSELSAEISAAEAKIERLRKQKAVQVKLGMDTSALTKSINESKTQLASLKKSVDSAGQSFSGMKPQVANGGNALMQFSRIAQDAPYGIIGIGNNITATVEAFGHLKQSTGSTGGALKALAGSIVGSGGILLAVSLVTTALTYMSQNNITVGDVLDKLSGNFDNLKKAMTDVNNEAIKNSGAEIASMNALVSISKDENNTRQERISAVQKLQDEYPAYFGNLTKEQILNGNVEVATKAVSFALIQKAKATILATKIGENELKILELQQKGQKEVADFVSGKGLFAILKGVTGQQAFKASADSTAKSIDNLKKEQALFTKELENSTKAANTFELANKKSSDKPKKQVSTGFTPQVSGIGMSIQSQGLVETSGKILQIAKDVQGAEGVIKTSMTGINVAFDTGMADVLLRMQDFNSELSNIITDGTVNALSGIGESIGAALASGGNVIDAVGKTILGSMGMMLKDLGKATIAYGVGLIAVKMAIKNPYLAVAAGVAMVALGSAMSTSLSKASSSNPVTAGGGGGGSISTGASYSSPASSSSGSSSTFSGGNVVFEISGTSLIGVLSNSLDKNKRLGGSLGIV